MKSYSERKIFLEQHVALMKHAQLLVEKIRPPLGVEDEIRCHELARAVWQALVAEGTSFIPGGVTDGHYGAVEHSWITLFIGGEPTVLDVYCCGRLPQVQLIDVAPTVPFGYKSGPERTDIDEAMVKYLFEEMRR